MIKNEKIIENFLLLAAVPRPSHHEEAVSKALYQWGLDKGLRSFRDEAGNVVIEKDGTPGMENAPLTILQGHMDMVCVAREGLAYNPLTDPIHVLDDGKTLTAAGTSLGGDDGIGVAMTMTLLEDEMAPHGPIRGIFTVDEEDGMSGAEALDAKFAQGDYLINLDWEEYGSLCCSSAGSDMFRLSRSVKAEEVPEGYTAFDITLTGLTGGHSGSSIHCGRANAIKELAGILQGTADAGISFRLASLDGGSAHNAIPASAKATVLVSDEDMPFFYSIAEAEAVSRQGRCAETDPDAQMQVLPAEALPEKCFSAEDSMAYIYIMSTVFDGVRTMSESIPGLVESSCNLGIAHATDTEFYFILHARSSEPERMAEMHKEFAPLAESCGFGFEQLSSSPAWPLKPGSELVEICTAEFKKLTGSDMRVEPVHAGLECGCFSAKNPKLDIISIGPDILDIHSPRETLVLDTVYACDDLVRNILKVIGEK